MGDVAHDYAEAFDGADTQQRHVTRLGENHFIVGFITVGAENYAANVAFNGLFGRGEKRALAARSHANFCSTSVGNHVNSEPASTNASMGGVT